MTSSAPDAPALNFSGHETFPFRYTWLPKGIQAILKDEHIFQRDDAIAQLGVGKNMVSAIRYWCRVLGLIDKDDDDRVIRIPTKHCLKSCGLSFVPACIRSFSYALCANCFLQESIGMGITELGKTIFADGGFDPYLEDVGEPFEEKMARLTGQHSEQLAESNRLDKEIKRNLAGLGYGF